ncbi:MAG TPA: DUF2231 domain-containing protein [Tepidisphaeraceae bacterium]|nr:DUF2231 domain-containing protein [Tepidisphaeraceae bacterium]
MTQFISPNWHVILIHYPLALLTVGVVIELLGCLWKGSTLRSAGRWMILLGVLATLPAVTTGIFAFADAAKGASTNPDAPWAQVVQGSRWDDAQWSYMRYHIWLTTTSTGLFLAALLVWMGSSDQWRVKLRWPVLAALVIALGGISAGAWFSGEAVYRYGVAVEPPAAAKVIPAGAPEQAPTTQTTQPTQVAQQVPPAQQAEQSEPAWQAYLDPVQLHLLLVGLTLASAIGALGLTIRRWNIQPLSVSEAAPMEVVPPGEQPLPLAEPTTTGGPAQIRPLEVEPPAVFPARFWLLAGILALLTGAVGFWMAEGDWRLPEITGILQQVTSGKELSTEQNRLFIHVILGVNIILLPLILALITRFSRRLKWITLIGVALLLIAVGFQLWYGVMLLYDL